MASFLLKLASKIGGWVDMIFESDDKPSGDQSKLRELDENYRALASDFESSIKAAFKDRGFGVESKFDAEAAFSGFFTRFTAFLKQNVK